MLLNFKPKRFTCYIDYFLLKLLLELISFFWPDVRYPFVAKMVVFTDIPFFWGGGSIVHKQGPLPHVAERTHKQTLCCLYICQDVPEEVVQIFFITKLLLLIVFTIILTMPIQLANICYFNIQSKFSTSLARCTLLQILGFDSRPVWGLFSKLSQLYLKSLCHLPAVCGMLSTLNFSRIMPYPYSPIQHKG